ncbi:MAG TPA: tetratricopeptide repeat protein, partial [Planctomycetota bacterium]|nr:tetratricopeptide repeat protein [Planctomycetota bacterium]
MKPNLLILPLIFSALACSPKPPPLAQPPADYSSDPDVQALVERMLSDAQANLGSATARRSLGLAYAANDLWIPARDCFRAALELDPKDLESRYQLAVAFGEAGDLPAKVQTLEALIADQPDYSPAVYLLAVEYLDQGQLDRAQPLFERVARNLPEMPHGLMGLGELALARDESVQAARQLEKAYQLAPMDTYIGFLLGQAYLGQGRESEAQPLLALGSTQGRPRLNPKSTVEMRSYRVSRSARLSEAVASLKKKDYAAAVSVLEDLHRKDPKDTTCLNNLAIAYLGTN